MSVLHKLDSSGHGEVATWGPDAESREAGAKAFDDLVGRGFYALGGLHGVGLPHAPGPRLDWVITGYESGPNARPRPRSEYIDGDEFVAAHLAESGWCYLRDATSGPGYFVGKGRKAPLTFVEAAAIADHFGIAYEHHGDGTTSIRVGKHMAGRLLDGALHSAFLPLADVPVKAAETAPANG